MADYEHRSASMKPPVRLQQHRLRGRFTDVNIAFPTRTFSAHRIVLSSTFIYFENYFANNPEEPIIELDEEIFHEVHLFESLLNYAYTGKIVFTETNGELLCRLFHTINEQELLDVSQRYLCSPESLNGSNIIRRLFHASKLGLEILLQGCKQHMKINPSAIYTSTEYLPIELERFRVILGMLEDEPASKEAKFKTIVNWVRHDLKERMGNLAELLNTIPLQELSFPFLEQVVGKEAIIHDKPETSRMLAEARTFALREMVNRAGRLNGAQGAIAQLEFIKNN